MIKIYGLILLALLAGCEKQAIKNTISSTELVSRIADQSAPLIIDVRSPEEFNRGHIPGAINVPVIEFTAIPEELNVAYGDEIVVYCETGRRAEKMKITLEKQGYYEVRHLDGDMKNWRDKALQTQ